MSTDKIETIETNFSDEGEISVTQIDHLVESHKNTDTCERSESVNESPVKSDISAGSRTGTQK